MRTDSRRGGTALLGALLLAAAVRLGVATAGSEPPELVAFEEEVRARTDWSARARADLGPDPFRVQAVPGTDRFVGLLRGADAVVLLDEAGRELVRSSAPEAPTGLALTRGGLYVVGEGNGIVARYRVSGSELTRVRDVTLDHAVSLRDVASLGDRILVLDPTKHRIAAIDPDSGASRTVTSCEGPVQLVEVGDAAVAICLLEGALVVLDERTQVVARITHDGPFWSVAGLEEDGRLLLAAGGVENRPLDRSDGAFGYIDSFLFLYAVGLEDGSVESRGTVNLSALGIVTPKWIDVARTERGLRVRTAGFATSDLVSLTWRGNALDREPRVERRALPPGTTDVSGPLVANPLLDAWGVLGPEGALVRPAPQPRRSAESRLGEALFFTTLMAPWNTSDGPRSRFTCETCHHEGYVDGRTHYTGRRDVHATTKPLVGLHGNRPYFSRALDPTMARMVHNEFRVANKKNGHDPWFPLRRHDVAWIGIGDDVPEVLSPILLRRSLMTFLMELEHTKNPSTRGRSIFSPEERAGAALFRDRCEGCHAARLVSDDSATRVSFESWEKNVFSSGTILWGRAGYEKTGIVPYVHPDGARVPSLRRLYRKRPYFTDGSAPDLPSVLERITTQPSELQHAATPPPQGLSAEDRSALLAFLGLL